MKEFARFMGLMTAMCAVWPIMLVSYMGCCLFWKHGWHVATVIPSLFLLLGITGRIMMLPPVQRAIDRRIQR